MHYVLLSAGGLRKRFESLQQHSGSAAGRQQQWQDSGDVSISGSEAGPSGQHQIPDGASTLYTGTTRHEQALTAVACTLTLQLHAHVLVDVACVPT